MDEGKAHVQKTLDLRDVIGDVACPTYVLQGAGDPIFPPHQTELVREATAGMANVEIVVEAQGDHCCHNIAHIVRPRMADWLAARI